jgi:parallel beta-helix repeat protein
MTINRHRARRFLLPLLFASILLSLSVVAQPVLSVTLAGQAFSAPRQLADDQQDPPDTPPPSSVTGPQRSITCPVVAVVLAPGTDIQGAVDAYPGGTTFCLKAGVHSIINSITPKTGDVFVGEYGAVLDGTRWTTTEPTQAAFRAHNQDIDDVTIRNLVIEHMPQRGIHAFPYMSDRWIVEYTEIWGGQVGIQLGNQSVLRHSWIHDNVGNPFSPIPAERGGGYSVYQTTDVLFEHNEISNNGPEQKVSLSTNVTFRDNFVHHNRWDGIWYDGDNVGSLIDRNRVEDNPGSGIFYEVSGRGIISNNVVRRNGEHGVFISTSKSVDIYNNVLEDNFRGIQYFVDCARVGEGAIAADLTNNIASGNLVSVGATDGSSASGLSLSSACAPGQAAAYVNGSKILQFANNRYSVPSTIGLYWAWGVGLMSFSDWQMLGLDSQGSISQQLTIRARPLR